MNRAVRKRAKKALAKLEKRLSKNRGDNLDSLMTKLPDEQGAKVLALFDPPSDTEPSQMIAILVKDLMESTETDATQIVPNFLHRTQNEKIDCSSGCAWCCHEPLQVSILGAVSVANYILEQDLVEDFTLKLDPYVLSLQKTQNKRSLLKQDFQPCPFLSEDKKCGVYEARPVICRAFHSKSVETCQELVRTENPEREVPCFPRLFGFTGLRLSGARRALRDLGLDDRPVVLAAAVQLLLEDFAGVTEAWLNGDDVFDNVVIKE